MAATRQTSQRITLVMLVLVSVTVITLDYRGEASHAIGHVRNGVADVLSPFQRATAAVLHPLGDVVSAAFHYGSQQAEIQQLQQQLGQMKEQVTAAQYGNVRADELFALADLPYAPNVPKVEAELISPSGSNFDPEVEIDQGHADGVGPGMPVVAEGGLVGTVVSASSSTAMVQLLTSARSYVSVEDTKTGIYDERGNGSGRPLSVPTTNAPPHVGDTLVTSGEDAGAYPPAIPVGIVTSVNPAPGGLSSTVDITPVVHLNDLQYVAVLQWLQPA